MKVNIRGQNIWLNFNHLYYFYIIENNGSLAKASEELKVGVSSLSSQLRQFEETLGIVLFERKNNRLILTSTGRIVYEYAEKIFTLGRELAETINSPLPTNRKSLNVGFYNGVPKNLIVEICKKFRDDTLYEVNIIRGHDQNPLEELQSGRMDLILINHPLTASERSHYYTKEIARSPVIICAHKKFKKLKSHFPGSLEEAPFFMPLHSEKLKNGLDNFFTKHGVKVAISGSSKDITLQKAVGVDGMALIAAPMTSVQDHLDNGDLIEIGQTGLTEEFYLVTSKSHSDTAMLSEVITKLENQF